MAALVGQALPPANREPVASFTHSCTLLVCSFDGTGSIDSDGQIVSHQWDFGDGADTGASVTHAYATGGTYAVTLTVTDDDGATHTVSAQVTVTETVTQVPVTFRASAGSDANTSSPGVTIPASVSTGDRLVMFITTNRAATATTPAGWTPLGSVSDGVDVRGWAFTKVAEPGDAGIVVRSTLDALSKTSMVLLAYSGTATIDSATGAAEAGSSATHAAPAAPGNVAANATVIWYWADKTSTVHGWTVHPALTTRASTVGSPSGMISAVAADAVVPTGGPVGPVSATAGVAASKAISWTVVVSPASA